MSISHEELKRLLHYDSETGRWKRLHPRAPFRTRSGYYGSFFIKGDSYPSHRLAWFFMTGAWPKQWVDHKNGDKQDDRWKNLRECTPSQNGANRKLSRSTSGLKGVSFNRQKKKWIATIWPRKNYIYLGQFDCPAAAHFAYLIAADKHFGEFARAR